MTAHRIGEFEFLNMVGPPEIPAEQVIVQRRAGVDHVSTFFTGKRSPPSQTITTAYGPSIRDAWDEYAEYLKLVDSSRAVPVMWAGITMPYMVRVLSVTPERNSPKATVIGIGPGFISRARLRCVWRLQVVEVL